MTHTILIVDDDLDTLQLVGTMLERQNYKILAANNGQKALELAEKNQPDLIILDIMMPGMDGYEVTRRLRTMEKTAFIPIIMFTAKAQVEDKVEGFESGANDYLTKPTHPAELIARVRTIMHRPKSGSLPPLEDGKAVPKGHVIGILAAKGGLGVSTLALNLGVSIHQQINEYVTVAEFRPGLGDIGSYLGYAHSEGLSRLLEMPASDISVEEVERELIIHGSGIQLLLSSSLPGDVDLISAADQFEAIARHLARLTPHVVLDLGVGLPDAVRKVLPLCREVIVVVEPTPFSVTRTRTLLDSLNARHVHSGRIHVVVVNRNRLEITLKATEIESRLDHKIQSLITPVPELVYQAAMRHDPLIVFQPGSLASQQIDKLARELAKKVSEGQD